MPMFPVGMLRPPMMYEWTNEGTPFTVEFNRFFEDDERSKEFQKYAYDGKIKTLFPDQDEIFRSERANDTEETFWAAFHRIKTNFGVTEDEFRRLYRAGEIELLRGAESAVLPQYYNIIQREVKDNYYYRQISSETPQRFLHHFHMKIRQRANVWALLLHSMSFLREDMAVNNYDLTETASYSNEVARNGKNTVEGSDGVEGTITDENEQNVKNKLDGTSVNDTQGKTKAVAYESDTPENSVDDIEHYMSTASNNQTENEGKTTQTDDRTIDETTKGKNTNTTNTTQTINRTIGNDSGEKGSGANTLRRVGNIGVMTSAQVLEGWRAGIYYDAFKVIFNDLESLFLGVF